MLSYTTVLAHWADGRSPRRGERSLGRTSRARRVGSLHHPYAPYRPPTPEEEPPQNLKVHARFPGKATGGRRALLDRRRPLLRPEQGEAGPHAVAAWLVPPLCRHYLAATSLKSLPCAGVPSSAPEQ